MGAAVGFWGGEIVVVSKAVLRGVHGSLGSCTHCVQSCSFLTRPVSLPVFYLSYEFRGGRNSKNEMQIHTLFYKSHLSDLVQIT